MLVKELIEKLEPYKDFKVQTTVHLAVKDEVLDKRLYPYPYDNYKGILEIDDIGHSDNVVCLGVTPTNCEIQE